MAFFYVYGNGLLFAPMLTVDLGSECFRAGRAGQQAVRIGAQVGKGFIGDDAEALGHDAGVL